MTDIKSMLPEELEALMKDMGESPFRARQIFSWLHEKGATSPESCGRAWAGPLISTA